MVTKLLHTRMRVDDLERSIKFYNEALGLEVGRRFEIPNGGQLVFLKNRDGDLIIELCHDPKGDPVQVQPDLMHVAFAVQDMAALEQDLAGKGYRFASGPTTSPRTGNILAFLDAPEGYGIELIQPPKP